MSQSIIESSLAGRETHLRFKPGEILFSEGEPPLGVHILHVGQADLLFSSRNGNVKPLRVAQPGQLLGLSCVVTRRDHDCTAIARTPCEVAFIEREDFLNLLDDSPAVWFSILRLLSNDVNAVYDDIRHMVAR